MSIWHKIRGILVDKSTRWYIAICVATTILIVVFASPFIGLVANLGQNEIYDMSKTLLSINATLFGLSAVAGGLFVAASTEREMRETFLHSRILEFVGISFLCFWIALLFAFSSLVVPTNRLGFAMSIGATVSGSLSGSIYLLYTFRNFLLSEPTQKEEKRG